MHKASIAPLDGDAPMWVLDTNVVLDWLVFDDPAMQQPSTWLKSGRALWVATDAMREEALEVAARPVFAKHGGAADLCAKIAAAFRDHARMLHPANAAKLRCADPDDQLFVDLALGHAAERLLTRDRALLALAPAARTQGLSIARPRDVPWALQRQAYTFSGSHAFADARPAALGPDDHGDTQCNQRQR
ncbi:MAG: PIN domain-containing protein [Proteobacteria bacterium]|nr:PIN domain-containing protein [Pseudomonadota bacterium]